MIRLIATDIDGTLVPEGAAHADPRLPGIIRALKERGVLFVAASGREYPNLLRMFGEVKDDIIFIATNGSKMMFRGELLHCAAMDPQLVRDAVVWLRTQPQRFMILSTLDGLWTDTKDAAYRQKVSEMYHLVQLDLTDDLLTVPGPVIKLAAFFEDGMGPVADTAAALFSGRAHVMTAGVSWLDFVGQDVDKAAALAKIQEMFGIAPEETMAFGDNANDAGMVRLAKYSYAAAGAVPETKAAARAILPDTKDSVVEVLQRLLDDPESFKEADDGI